MNWDDLRIVLALARAGTLSGAARALRIDRTTVGRRLAALEDELGTRLLVRRDGAQRPTDAAHAIGARAAGMEATALSIARAHAGAEGRVAGQVTVTATEALGSRLLAPALAALTARHPGLSVNLALEARSRSLAQGEADLAVRLLPPSEPTSVGRRVGSVGYGAYAARRRRQAAQEGLLVWDVPIAGEETEWLRKRFPSAEVRLRSGSTAALVAATRAGAGVAVLPCFVGDVTRELVRLDVPGEIPPSPLWVIVHRDARRSAAVATVRTEVERVLAEARPALEGARHGAAEPPAARARRSPGATFDG